jgi:hypothetical protein
MVEDSGIQWSIDTHEHHEHSIDWYWGLGLIALAAAALSIFLGNALLAVIIFLAALSLGILVHRGPREHTVGLNPRGVSMDGTLYRWSSVVSFWIQQDTRDPHLLITTEGILHPQLVIPLVDPGRAQNVRAYIKRFAKEEEQRPHMGHHIAQMLGL